jgi:two-component system cell cycle response regulator
VTRTRPETVRERFGLRKTPLVWLTQNADPVEKCISPTDMPRIHFVISDFLDKAEDSVILLEGLEYIITHNSFPSALKLIQLLNDKVMLHKSRMIVPADPAAVGDKEWALLERDMRTLPEN